MFLLTVIEVVYLSFRNSLKSATDCCYTERQIQPDDAFGCACNARIFQHCFHENCLQMIEKEQWPPNNSPYVNTMEISCLEATHEAILTWLPWLKAASPPITTSLNLELIKFWPFRAPGKGVYGRANFFWLRLTTASVQCLRLSLSERFFHFFCNKLNTVYIN